MFNHRQTEELLNNGYTASRGRALASGTAHANTVGGGGSGKVGGKTSNSAKKAANSATKGIQKVLDKFSKLFDWIEVRLDRLQTKIDRNLSKSELAQYLNTKSGTGKNDYINKAIKLTKDEITAARKGADRYRKQADIVAKKTKLSPSIVKKIKNGTIDIRSYGETTQDKIAEYQKWYEKSQDCIDKQIELRQSLVDLNQQKLDNIIDYYGKLGDAIDATKGKQEAYNDLLEKTGKSSGKTSNYDAIIETYKQQAKTSNQSVANIQAERAAYKKEFERQQAKALSDQESAQKAITKANKTLNSKKSSKRAKTTASANKKAAQQKLSNANAILAEKTDIALQTALDNYDEAIYQAQIDAQEALDSVYEKKIEALENSLDSLKSQADTVENKIEIDEAKGKTVSKSYYDQLQKNSQQQAANLQSQRVIYREQQIGLDVTSTKYQEIQAKINDIDLSLQDITKQQLDWNQAVFQLDVDRIDALLAKYQAVADQLDAMSTLHETQRYDHTVQEFVDKIANADNEINVYIEKAAKYQAELDKMGTANVDSEKYQEYLSVVNDCNQSILDLKNSQEEWNDAIIDIKIDAITKQREELEKISDQYDRQLKLQKAQEALAQARASRKNLVFYEGIGFVYTADRTAIKEAQDALDDAAYEEVLNSLDDILDALEDLKGDNNIYDYNANKITDGSTDVTSKIEELNNAANKLLESGKYTLVDVPTALSALASIDLSSMTDVLYKTAMQSLSESIKSVMNDGAGSGAGQSVTLTIGDIYVQGVDDPDGLANAIVNELPAVILQKLRSR